MANAAKLLFEPLLTGRTLREEICVDGRTEVLKLPGPLGRDISAKEKPSPSQRQKTLEFAPKALFPKDAKKSCVIRLPILHLESPQESGFPSVQSASKSIHLADGNEANRTLMVASTRLRLMVFHNHSQAVSWVVLQTFGSLADRNTSCMAWNICCIYPYIYIEIYIYI